VAPSYSVSPLKFCEACGTPITPGTSFCTNCGSPIRQEPQSPKRIVSLRSILVMLVVLMAGVAAGSLLVRPKVPSNTSQMLVESTVVSVSSTTFTVVTTLTPASSTSMSSTTSTSVIGITTSSSSTAPLTTLQQATTYSTPSTQIRTSSTISYRSSTTYVPSPTSTSRSGCDPSYPTVCIPPPPPDLDCKDIPYRNFVVLPPDPHHFDGDHDGIGCET
jgi:predicted nucleic acid-binding Zn ribbon protein